MIRVVCSVCGRAVASRIPRGGDGSLRKPLSHKDADKRWCEGAYLEAEEWLEDAALGATDAPPGSAP